VRLLAPKGRTCRQANVFFSNAAVPAINLPPPETVLDPTFKVSSAGRQEASSLSSIRPPLKHRE